MHYRHARGKYGGITDSATYRTNSNPYDVRRRSVWVPGSDTEDDGRIGDCGRRHENLVGRPVDAKFRKASFTELLCFAVADMEHSNSHALYFASNVEVEYPSSEE